MQKRIFGCDSVKDLGTRRSSWVTQGLRRWGVDSAITRSLEEGGEKVEGRGVSCEGGVGKAVTLRRWEGQGRRGAPWSLREEGTQPTL